MRISDWSSDVCSSDLPLPVRFRTVRIRHCLRAGNLLRIGFIDVVRMHETIEAPGFEIHIRIRGVVSIPEEFASTVGHYLPGLEVEFHTRASFRDVDVDLVTIVARAELLALHGVRPGLRLAA